MSTQQFKSPASRKLKFQLIFIAIVVILAELLTWLIMGESSPFQEYFLWHPGLRNMWGMTMLGPYIIGALIAGNPHAPSEVIVVVASIVQWCFLGWLLSIPLAKWWLRLQNR